MTEAKFTHLHALTLIEYAEDKGLADTYQQAWMLLRSGDIRAENAASEEFQKLLSHIPPDELEEVLRRFVEIARGRMDSLPVEIISAIPLTSEQLFKIQMNLIRILRKQLHITTTLDPSLLGGVRIIVDNSVIDHSVKRRLSDMKEAIYKGVYQTHE